MAVTAPTKPATLPATAVAQVVFDLAQNAAYRAAKRGQLVEGLPVFRAGGQRWQVATANVERVIGRELTVDDLTAITQADQALADERRVRRADPVND